jgi:hypothetical protein
MTPPGSLDGMVRDHSSSRLLSHLFASKVVKELGWNAPILERLRDKLIYPSLRQALRDLAVKPPALLRLELIHKLVSDKVHAPTRLNAIAIGRFYRTFPNAIGSW